ncbi:putative rho gtpase activator rga [Phaeomoniella chlamydospora]|uniref:Putative rho gtpase activator rga n=1 Tax=Phaeomoniella chlamydospora TaxID=158046 RepID=A0A0G2EGB2_PHACM|nr:putative rho gtpase activator rga [Phaeomoniella chlamydospora]
MSSTPELSTPQSDGQSETPTDNSLRNRPVAPRLDPAPNIKRSNSPATRDGLTLPADVFKNKRHSFIAPQPEEGGFEQMEIPLAFDPTPPATHSSPQLSNSRTPRQIEEQPRDYFNTDRSAVNVSRKPSAETQPSPHIAYQEKGRQPSNDVIDNIMKRREMGGKVNGSSVTSPPLSENHRHNQQASPKVSRQPSDEKFKLQDVPKRKRAGSKQSSYSESKSPHLESPPTANGDTIAGTSKTKGSSSDSMVEKSREQAPAPAKLSTPRPSYESRSREGGSVELSRPAHIPTQSPQPPKRGDSLSTKSTNSIPRKEVGGVTRKTSLSVRNQNDQSAPSVSKDVEASSTPKLSSGKSISKPVESPKSKSLFDTAARSEGSKDPFVAPRAPPAPPPPGHKKSESISTMQSDTPRLADNAGSPSLPRYSAGGDFTMEEDMARILSGEDGGSHESFLKRVSNSVRHGRSFSDKGMRLTKEHKWPKSPVTSTTPQDMSSPVTASPENREELTWYKNELRRERQKTLEKERRVSELEAMVNSTTEIKLANSELREKRSTMVVLDAQKEIVVRELEVLTEHIAQFKKTTEPDLNKFANSVLRDFSEALVKLRDSYAPKIEHALTQKQEVVAEISTLNQMKENLLQEFEQLSLKNAQLAELNNTLVHQIQGLYKKGAKEEEKPPTNGLGIYSHHKEKSQVSIDSKEVRPSIADMSMTSSVTAVQPEEAEPITVIQGPQVVNIRKGQPKKFNWKKGQNVAKGVTKGLKGAFSSTQQSYAREMQFTETAPYGSTPPSNDYPNLPKSSGSEQTSSTQKPGGFGGFWGNQKATTKPAAPLRMQSNDSSTALAPDPSTTLFGADLEQRAEFEKTPIPYIVTRCIEEVEVRGMDVEGIYRKSGGNSQILIVKEGFEKNPQSFNISDPDLDIHAVTSGLKQYLRRLPTPLITYEVYDKILDACNLSTSEAKVQAMQHAIIDLPQVHQDVLEFLVFHLKRVVGHEKENLMTPLNIAVVFAPTIMRPESLTREMTDTQKKNEAVQFLVENCQAIFLDTH